MPEARFGPSPEIREQVSTLHPPADVDTGLLFCLQTAVRASVVLFQCPASFQTSRPNIENLSRFFQKIGPQPFRLAWEPRGPWQAEFVRDLCTQYRLIHCVDPLISAPDPTNATYWRLHGKGSYSYRYTDDDLLELRKLLFVDPSEPRVYILFNNVTMKEDANRFRLLLDRVGH